MKMFCLRLILILLTGLTAKAEIHDQRGVSPTINPSIATMKASQLIETALAAEDAAYLEAEHQLRNLPGAAEELRPRLLSNNYFERAFAKVLLDWIQGRAKDNEAVLVYFPEVADKKKRTPALLPRPAIVARDLSFEFQERVAEFLAIRLVKETAWPEWQVSGVILYLAEQKLPATSAALIRFAANERNAPWQHMAIEAITAIRDPELSDKIKFERLRLEATKKSIPKPLALFESR